MTLDCTLNNNIPRAIWTVWYDVCDAVETAVCYRVRDLVMTVIEEPSWSYTTGDAVDKYMTFYDS
jgi:hypothetical protein